jgi:hypothetical protein
MKRSLSLATVTAALLIAAPLSHAVPVTSTTLLSGANENPANASLGTGSSIVTIDTDAHTLRVQIEFSGLTGTTTAAHIHCCTAPPGNVGVATQLPSFDGFPLGVTSGIYDHTFDLSDELSFNPAFVDANGDTAAGAEAALAAGLANGLAYVNVHTDVFTGGEIRGFLRAVPEPSMLPLIGVALLGLGLGLRARPRG